MLPGLIDAHAHAGHALVKTLGCGDGRRRVSDWARACHELYTVGSTEGFWEAEAELCALERLKVRRRPAPVVRRRTARTADAPCAAFASHQFGITTGVSVLGGGDMVFRTDDARYGVAHCRGVARVGTKSVVAVGANRPSAMVPIDADTPRAEWVYAHVDEADGKERVTETKVDADSQLRVCEELIRRCHGAEEFRGRVRIAMCPPVHDPRGALPEAVSLEEVLAAAARHRALANEHEGVTFTQDGHTGGSIAFAEAHGLLDGSASFLSHCTDLEPEDIDALRRSGAAVVHNPSASWSIAGYCPVPALLDAGVTVAIGSDGTSPNRSTDLFRHMQQCMHYHRRQHRDPQMIPPGKALEMCTIDSARALGVAHEVGSLEPGKRADIVLVNLAAPHIAPLRSMPLEHAVCYANGSDVDTVIVDGEVLMRARRVLSVNEADVIERASNEAESAVRRCGLEPLRGRRPGFWGCSRWAA